MAPTLPGFQGIKRFVQYMDSHPHKPIFYPSNTYGGSKLIRLSWIEAQVEYHTSQKHLKFHQDAYHTIIINRRPSVSVIIYNMFGVDVFWKVHIHPDISSDSTDG